MKIRISPGWIAVVLLSSCGEAEVAPPPAPPPVPSAQAKSTTSKEAVLATPPSVSLIGAPIQTTAAPVVETPATREIARQTALQELQRTQKLKRFPNGR